MHELEQQTAVVREAKSVLDSWVRYEGQVKARQQKEVADAVISRVEKELENPKVLKQILDQSVSEIESRSSNTRKMNVTNVVPELLTSKEAAKA